jgi:hypothetical protein
MESRTEWLDAELARSIERIKFLEEGFWLVWFSAHDKAKVERICDEAMQVFDRRVDGACVSGLTVERWVKDRPSKPHEGHMSGIVHPRHAALPKSEGGRQ